MLDKNAYAYYRIESDDYELDSYLNVSKLCIKKLNENARDLLPSTMFYFPFKGCSSQVAL